MAHSLFRVQRSLLESTYILPCTNFPFQVFIVTISSSVVKSGSAPASTLAPQLLGKPRTVWMVKGGDGNPRYQLGAFPDWCLTDEGNAQGYRRWTSSNRQSPSSQSWSNWGPCPPNQARCISKQSLRVKGSSWTHTTHPCKFRVTHGWWPFDRIARDARRTQVQEHWANLACSTATITWMKRQVRNPIYLNGKQEANNSHRQVTR